MTCEQVQQTQGICLPSGCAAFEPDHQRVCLRAQSHIADVKTHRPPPSSGEARDDFLAKLRALNATLKVQFALGVHDVTSADRLSTATVHALSCAVLVALLMRSVGRQSVLDSAA